MAEVVLRKPACHSTRQVEQAFYQDHRREEADRVPSEQALGTRQQPMGEGGTDTAAVQVNDLAVLAAGKDYAPAESVAALAWIRLVSNSTSKP